MAKLPAAYRINRLAEDRDPYPRGLRGPSIVGRGDTRCGLCQRVFYEEDGPTEMYFGERCHSSCVEAEEQGS